MYPIFFKIHFTIHIELCQIFDVSKLAHVFSVELCYCSGLKDISMLGRVQNLCVVGCKEIEIFCKPLGKNQNWDLSFTNIADLTGFEVLHTLNISTCKNVRDVSHLSTLYALNISACCMDEENYENLIGIVPNLKYDRIRPFTVDRNNFDNHQLRTVM